MILKTGRVTTEARKDGVITYKGFLAPDPEDLLRWNYGHLNELEFKKKYFADLSESVAHNPQLWKDLMEKESITLLCDCGSMMTMAEQAEADKLCHRFMLQEFIADLMKAMDKAVKVIKEVDADWNPPLPIHQKLFGDNRRSKALSSTRAEIIALKENTQSFGWL